MDSKRQPHTSVLPVVNGLKAWNVDMYLNAFPGVYKKGWQKLEISAKFILNI